MAYYTAVPTQPQLPLYPTQYNNNNPLQIQFTYSQQLPHPHQPGNLAYYPVQQNQFVYQQQQQQQQPLPQLVPVLQPQQQPQQPMTKEAAEKLYGRKKCSRCSTFYSEAQNTTCYYHPGKCTEPNISKGTMIGWSCCRYKEFVSPDTMNMSILNDAAMDRNCRGCRVAVRHLEDLTFTHVMSYFPFDSSALAEQQQQNSNNQENNSSNLPPPPPAIQDLISFQDDITATKTKTTSTSPPSSPEFTPSDETLNTPIPIKKIGDVEYYVHKVTTTDTLVGISLKYHVPIGELQRINKLGSSRQIFHKKYVLIPKGENTPIPQNEPDSKYEILMTFKAKTRCSSSEEAKYYLESTDYNIDQAIAEYEEDQRWEKETNTKSPNTKKETTPKKPTAKQPKLCCAFTF